MSTQDFLLASSAVISREEVGRLLDSVGGELEPKDYYIGLLSYQNNHIWISVTNGEEETTETLAEKEALLGAPPRSFIVLNAFIKSVDISFQLVHDFAYLFIQKHPHCLLDNYVGDFISEEDIIQLCRERYFCKDVPPLYERPLNS